MNELHIYSFGGRGISPFDRSGGLAEYVKGLWTAFPDFHIEVWRNRVRVGRPWLVHRTSTGQGADGSAPTGGTVTLKGASIIQVEGDKIVSDQCYFDRVAVAEQLQPKD